MTVSNGQGFHAGRTALPAAGPARAARAAWRHAARWADPACYALLAALVLGLYLPALSLGLIWDDPLWFQQGAGQSAWQIVTSLSTYQFFRPVAILLNRALVSPAGVVNVTAAHAIQVAAHLSSTLVCIPVLRALGLSARHARLTAVVFAMQPLSYQAVAWQSPQQPLAILGVLLSLACAARAYRGRPGPWLVLSVLAYAAALLIQESALPFVVAFIWLAAVQGRPRPRWWWWPAAHLALAGLYALAWLTVPRLDGVTGAGFQLPVLAYLLQGAVFPLAATLAALLPALAQWPVAWLSAVYLGLAVLLVLAAARWTSTRGTLLCAAWAAAGLLPVWAGLSWDYVQIGERLLYPAALGIAGLWAALMLWLAAPGPAWRRVVGALVVIVVVSVSLSQWLRFQRLYRLGTDHLAEAARVLSAAPDSQVLFVNFPDRLALRPQPYALGYWGLTLAPVAQDLAGFAIAAAGQSAADRSAAVFAIGASAREAWPYRVDMRGENTPPAGVWAAASWADLVYLSDYGPQGELTLRPVGAVRPVPDPQGATPLATLEGGAALLAAELVPNTGQPPGLRLLWHTSAPLPADTTIFVHLWRGEVYEVGADGDSLGGLLPAAAWQPEGAVLDLRLLPDLSALPGEYEVRVGLYHRTDEARLPAFAPDGQRLPGDEITVATLRVP